MLVGMLVFVFQKAYSMATHLALFRLREVTISGNWVVPADHVRSLAQIEAGQNIFSVALTESAARIQAEPMVKTVHLSRKLPDRIAVSITEREPIALLARDRLYGVDSEGVLLPPFPPERMPDVPIFTSIGADTTEPGGVIQSLRLKEGIRFINEMRAREPGLIAVISEIHLGSREGLMLYLIDGGMKVKWGRGAFERKIGPFRAALSQIPSKHRLPSYLDVRFEGQVVARF
jgi:cell division protein FtsQ